MKRGGIQSAGKDGKRKPKSEHARCRCCGGGGGKDIRDVLAGAMICIGGGGSP